MKVKYFQRYVGISLREFTPEEHGEKYEDLAKEFAATNKGKIVEHDHVIKEEEKTNETDDIIEEMEEKPKRKYTKRAKVNVEAIIPRE